MTAAPSVGALLRIAHVLGCAEEEIHAVREGRQLSDAQARRLAEHVLSATEDVVRGLEVSKREQSILSTALETYARQVQPVVAAALPLLDFSKNSDNSDGGACWRPPTALQVIEWAQRAVLAPDSLASLSPHRVETLQKDSSIVSSGSPFRVNQQQQQQQQLRRHHSSWAPQPPPHHLQSKLLLQILPQIRRMIRKIETIVTGDDAAAASSLLADRDDDDSGSSHVAGLSLLVENLVERTSLLQSHFTELHRNLSSEIASLRDAVVAHRQRGVMISSDDGDVSTSLLPLLLSSPADAASTSSRSNNPTTATLRAARDIIVEASVLREQYAQQIDEAQRISLCYSKENTQCRLHHEGEKINSNNNNNNNNNNAATVNTADEMMEKAGRSRRNAMLAALRAERDEIVGRISLLQHEAVTLCSEVVASSSTCPLSSSSAIMHNNNNNKRSAATRIAMSHFVPVGGAEAVGAGRPPTQQNSGDLLGQVREQLADISEALGVAASAIEDRAKMMRAMENMRSEMAKKELAMKQRVSDWGATIGAVVQHMASAAAAAAESQSLPSSLSVSGGRAQSNSRNHANPSCAALVESLTSLGQQQQHHDPAAFTSPTSRRRVTSAPDCDEQFALFDKIIAALAATASQSIASGKNQRLRLSNLLDEQRKRGKKMAALSEQATLMLKSSTGSNSNNYSTAASSPALDSRDPNFVDALLDALVKIQHQHRVAVSTSTSQHQFNASADASAQKAREAATSHRNEKEEEGEEKKNNWVSEQQQQQQYQVLQRQHGLLCETMRSLVLQLDPENDQLDDESLDDGAQIALAKFKATLTRLVEELRSAHALVSGGQEPPFELLDGFVSDAAETAAQLSHEIKQKAAALATVTNKQYNLIDDVDDEASKQPHRFFSGAEKLALHSRSGSATVYASPPRSEQQQLHSSSRKKAKGEEASRVEEDNNDSNDNNDSFLSAIGQHLHDAFRALMAGTQIKYLHHGADMQHAAAIAESEMAGGGLFSFLTSSSSSSSSSCNEHAKKTKRESLLRAAEQVAKLGHSFTTGLKLVAILLQKDVDAAQSCVAQMLKVALQVNVDSLGCSREAMSQLRAICDPAHRQEQRGRYFFFSSSPAAHGDTLVGSGGGGEHQQPEQHPLVAALKGLDRVFSQVTASCLDWKKRAEESDQIIDSVAFHVVSRISNSAPPSHWSRALPEERIQQELPSVVDRLAEEALNGVPLQHAIDLEANMAQLRHRMEELELDRDTAESAAAVARAQLLQQQQLHQFSAARLLALDDNEERNQQRRAGHRDGFEEEEGDRPVPQIDPALMMSPTAIMMAARSRSRSHEQEEQEQREQEQEQEQDGMVKKMLNLVPSLNLGSLHQVKSTLSSSAAAAAALPLSMTNKKRNSQQQQQILRAQVRKLSPTVAATSTGASAASSSSYAQLMMASKQSISSTASVGLGEQRAINTMNTSGSSSSLASGDKKKKPAVVVRKIALTTPW